MKLLLAFLGVALVLCFVPRRLLGIAKGPLVFLTVVAGFVAMPLMSFNAVSDQDEAFEWSSITRYQAHFRVDRNGDLAATEKLVVYFPVARHGIFRFFDLVDPSALTARRVPEDITVLRDGKPEEFDLSRQSKGRFRVVRIGSPSVELEGEHEYTIRYTVRGVIEPGTTGERSQFYWNLVPGGWTMSIDRAELVVDLPVPAARSVRCAVGLDATDGCASVEGAGTRRLHIGVGELPPRTPVTVKTGLDIATPPAGHAVPWSPRWDPVLGRSLPVALIVGLLVLAAAGFGVWSRLRVHERNPAFPLMYAPPDDLGPAQAAFLLAERAGRDQFVATLLHAAQQGAVSLRPGKGDGWVITTESPARWTDLDVVTRAVGSALKIRKSGKIELGKDQVKAGKTVQNAEREVSLQSDKWARDAGLLVDVPGTSARGWWGLVAVVFAVPWALINPFGISLAAAIPGAYGAWAVMLLGTGAATRRTDAGRDLWSRIGGFKRMLETESSAARFDFSANKDLYTAYIPWAVAFGVADAWARKYRVETGEEPPIPSYLPAGSDLSGSDVSSSVSAMTASVGAAVGAAISAYSASIATSSSSSGSSWSSGSSGGGFSGGGGGGGGGGGSW